jgi:hypothetical protein
MRIGRGMKKLVMDNGWAVGLISSDDILYVGKFGMSHEELIEKVIGGTY